MTRRAVGEATMLRVGWLLWGLWACDGGSPGDDGEQDGPPPDPAVVVELVTAAQGEVIDALLASGAVEAERSADVASTATGRVLRVDKDVGDPVSRGDTLAVLQNESLEVSVDRAADEVATLERRLEDLRALAAVGALPIRDVQDAEASLRTAIAGLREAAVSARETRLVAPFDGVVAVRELRVGEQVAAGARAFQVVDLSTLRVSAALPERDVTRVAMGQVARVSGAYDEAQTATARVTRIAPVIDPASGTFQVTLTLDPGGALRPGQYVDLALELRRKQDVLVIPRAALVHDGGKTWVFRVIPAPPPEEEPKGEVEEEEAGGGWFAGLFGGAAPEEAPEVEEAPVTPRRVAERVQVELGLVDAARAEVVSGLTAGDAVVVVGQANLKDGAAVKEPHEVAAEREAKKAKADAAEAADPAAETTP